MASGKSIMFDINCPTEVSTGAAAASPTILYVMNPGNHDINVSGAGTKGEGRLIKSMQGRATFQCDLGHTGLNLISEGSLAVDGAIAGPVELRARGTLAGNVTLQDTITFEGALNYEGCRLLPGDDGFGIITSKKSMVLPGNVYVEVGIELLQPDNVCRSGLLNVEGDLTFQGTNCISIRNVRGGEGEYLLAECTGTLTCDPSKLKTRGLEGVNYDLVVRDGKQLLLVINPTRAPQTDVVWTGNESGTWDYKAQNFAINDEATAFVSGDALIFPEEAQQRTITLTDMMPTAGVRFTHQTGNYTLGGDGGLSGDGDFVSDGTGNIVLNTTRNEFSGRVRLNNGRITVKNLEMAGTPSCLGVGQYIDMDRATLVVNNTNAATDRQFSLTDTATISVPSGTVTLKNTVSGKGMLVKSGSGQLNLSYGGTNAYAGTILDGGTLAQGLWNSSIGSSGSPILVRGNSSITIFNNNSTSQVPQLTNVITIAQGKTLTINGGKRCSVAGSLKGEGTLKISFPYTRGDVSTNFSAFEGTVEVTSGQFRLTSAMDLSKATFQVDAGVYVAGVQSGSSTEKSFTHKIGALVSTASDAQFSTGTWNVGYLNTNTTFAGNFTSAAPLHKYGEGSLSLTGSSACTIGVHAGVLSAENTSLTTSGLVTVDNGARLCGTGKLASVTVNKGGTLSAGKPTGTVVGTLTLTGNLNMRSGAILRVRGRGSIGSTDKFNVAGAINLASPVFQMERLSGEWAPGTDYIIFSGEGTIKITGTPTFEPAQPLPGYVWDYSRLTTEGVLCPQCCSGSCTPAADAPGQSAAYDLSGRRVTKTKTHGIYIINGRVVSK